MTVQNTASDLLAHSKTTLRRLWPRLEERFGPRVKPLEWEAFQKRVEAHFSALFAPVFDLYGEEYDFFFHLETILQTVTEAWIGRDSELRALDALREEDPTWFQSHRMVGATYYLDLFAGDFDGLRE